MTRNQVALAPFQHQRSYSYLVFHLKGSYESGRVAHFHCTYFFFFQESNRCHCRVDDPPVLRGLTELSLSQNCDGCVVFIDSSVSCPQKSSRFTGQKPRRETMDARPNKNTLLVWLCLTCCDQTRLQKRTPSKIRRGSILFYSETGIDTCTQAYVIFWQATEALSPVATWAELNLNLKAVYRDAQVSFSGTLNQTSLVHRAVWIPDRSM